MAKTKKFEQNDNNLAVAYYRYSSHSQNDASINQQRELVTKFAESKGYNIVHEYWDEGISGTIIDRPGYQSMLSEIDTIKPNAVLIWKTDRLARLRLELGFARKSIADAGAKLISISEPMLNDDSPEAIYLEALIDAGAEYYSRNLSKHIKRGMNYNAEHALYNGHKVWGYGVDFNKKYVIDNDIAPFVRRMFTEYAAGKPMQDTCDDFNEQGLRTSRGALFGVKTMNKLLQNRAYIGEYKHGDYVVEGGMPAIIDEELFDKVQKMFVINKRSSSNKRKKMQEIPRNWLTGKLFCGECGTSICGTSGTSKTGRIYYYYHCVEHKKNHGKPRKVRKEWIEDVVTGILKGFLDDSENLASIAVDAARYYEEHYKSTTYLESLEEQRKSVEKGLANFVKAIEMGIFNEETQKRMQELSQQKEDLNAAIEAENVRQALFEDENSIKAYFDKFLHADFNNPEVRDSILEYFVDKIYLYEDKLVVMSWYSEDNREVPLEVLNADDDPFIKGEAVEFDCFPFGSTLISYVKALEILTFRGFFFFPVPVAWPRFALIFLILSHPGMG
ncbi:recombinase family protein [Scardovia wiggsiae]|uniref:recombinase family protein n=1 Tax=Scardovia wiggsiae TaxID=230143 RepID=UPI00374EAE34